LPRKTWRIPQPTPTRALAEETALLCMNGGASVRGDTNPGRVSNGPNRSGPRKNPTTPTANRASWDTTTNVTVSDRRRFASGPYAMASTAVSPAASSKIFAPVTKGAVEYRVETSATPR
jgi:hypothetical protein